MSALIELQNRTIGETFVSLTLKLVNGETVNISGKDDIEMSNGCIVVVKNKTTTIISGASIVTATIRHTDLYSNVVDDD